MFKLSSQAASPKRGIQSIEVGFRLLEALADGQGRLSLKDLAAAAHMSPSKAHLYLVSFQRIGLVEQDPATTRYSLGATAVRLGIAAINQTDLLEVAKRYIDETVSNIGVAVSLSVWGNLGPTIVFRRDGPQPVPISIRLGFVLPILTTATGKIFAAHQAESVWMTPALLEEQAHPGLLESFKKEIPVIRRRGFASTEGQLHEGFFGVSAAIFDGSGSICGAVTALGMSGAVDLSERGNIAQNVLKLGLTISNDLGSRRLA